MPLATNPNRTVPAWLASDADQALETRPVFLCRFLTSHDVDELYDEYNAIVKIEDYDERNKQLSAFLAKGVVGWRNIAQPGEFGARTFIKGNGAQFDLVLTVSEKFELADLMLTRPRASEVELKKSSSSAPIGEASSAPAAATPDDAQKTP
jgi:hypothetical protein